MRLQAPQLDEALVETPTTKVLIDYRGVEHEVLLKHECNGPTGSIKDRTALGLVIALDEAEPLQPGEVVVESTSGNLGLGLARLLAVYGCHLIAVIDPKTSTRTRELLEAADVELDVIDRPDGRGGYLLSRLRRVRDLLTDNPGYRWPNQYGNPANPLVHRLTTGPEIIRQAGPDLDAVYVAVSTGGTLAGIAGHLRSLDRAIRIVAVDGPASMVTSRPLERSVLGGIGASRPSRFLRPDSYDTSVRVRDVDAIAMCRVVLEGTGIGLGGSAGSVLSACVEDLAGQDAPRLPLCLCPDDGAKYRDTIYDDGWLRRFEMTEDVYDAIARLRADGLRFKGERPC